MSHRDPFSVRTQLKVGDKSYWYYSLPKLEEKFPGISRLPYSIKVLLEAAVRKLDGRAVTEEHVTSIGGMGQIQRHRKK